MQLCWKQQCGKHFVNEKVVQEAGWVASITHEKLAQVS